MTPVFWGKIRIRNSDWVDTNTELNLSEITALMWAAVKDQSAYDARFGKSTTPELDIDSRMNVFVEYLWRAHREYNLDENSVDNMKLASSACLPGTFNKVVESLDKLHPDVTIIRSKESANTLAVEEAKNFYLNYPDQKALYDAHTALEPTPEQRRMLEAMKAHVESRLIEVVGDTIDPNEIQLILSNLEYVTLPDPDNGVSDILQEEMQEDAMKKTIDPIVEEAIQWAMEADIDEYEGIASKASGLGMLDACLTSIDNRVALNFVQQTVIKRTGYTDSMDNFEALRAHLQKTKESRIKDIVEAHRGYKDKHKEDRNLSPK